MELRTASKTKVKIKLGISGASGFGKTKSALLLASGLAPWEKIALIDTENGSGELYSDLGPYLILPLTPPYTPERYIEAINVCLKAGVEVVIVDSISHEWEGEGGCIDIHESLGGGFRDWKHVTPRHRALINKILHSPVHVITTTRRKQEYDLIKNDKGKIEPKKVGTKEITREGFEYELTINFELINDENIARPSKDRTGLFKGQQFVITPETGKKILEWCHSGEEPPKPTLNEKQLNKAIERIKKGEIELKERIPAEFALTNEQLKLIQSS